MSSLQRPPQITRCQKKEQRKEKCACDPWTSKEQKLTLKQSQIRFSKQNFKIYWGENMLENSKENMDLMSKQSNSAKKWDL